ncbi:MAG: hypothetical protein JETT_3285 [Candidatus Jettenia ecosi]|uniref:Type II secretion system protein GspC N-terminal domain-containing protein n=1 Tax=Candidatus Jettenia ecosi TaxID=2494326 RepID=A0A533Q746_9BACT|nr:MAG: hypothetical protein JETT_3285 [Candidatus Jettenia ecosi]
MKLIHMNTKSVWVVIEIFKKKIKQWKYYLPIINLGLFVSVAILAILCVWLVYRPTEDVVRSEKYKEGPPVNKNLLPSLVTNAKEINYYEHMLSSNPFSPNRGAWVSSEIQKGSTQEVREEGEDDDEEEGIEQTVVSQQKPRGTPVKIVLQGILILGNTKKALIENPNKVANKKPFIFVEEGDEIAEYKVKNIESNLIKLDWYGEEQTVVMRPGIKE